ncbi:hypothetical protein ACH6CV_16625 [Bacillota bacterium Meth-B3]
MTTDLRMSLGNKWLYLTCLVVFCVLLRPCIEPLTPLIDGRADIDYITLTAHRSMFSGLMPFAVLFCVIPYACSFFDEMKSGFTRSALLHTTRRRYIAGKLLAVTVSGALALAIPYALTGAIGYALCQPVVAPQVPDFYVDTSWEPVLARWGGESMLLLQVLLAGLYGAVWSLSGLFCSCLLAPPDRDRRPVRGLSDHLDAVHGFQVLPAPVPDRGLCRAAVDRIRFVDAGAVSVRIPDPELCGHEVAVSVCIMYARWRA